MSLRHLLTLVVITAVASAKLYSSWMLDSIVVREQGSSASAASTGYIALGILQSALRKASLATSDETQATEWMGYLNETIYNTGVLTILRDANNDTQKPLDRLSVGNALLYHYERAGDPAALATMNALRKSIDYQPENQFGGLWYYVYPNWSYLDGMWSYAPFLAHYIDAAITNPSLIWDDATFADVAYQINLLWNHNLIKSPTGGHLLVHGYDATKTAVWANSVTGASPFVWSRALGWYIMGLVDSLEIMQNATKSRSSRSSHERVVSKLRAHFRMLAVGVSLAADPVSGVWHQVMNPPAGANLERNFLESSGSAMFVYALLKGVKLGYLQNGCVEELATVSGTRAPSVNFVAVASKAYRYILENFVVHDTNGTLSYNGTVEVCSLNSTATYDYYTGRSIEYNSLLGSAAFVLASLELEKYRGL